MLDLVWRVFFCGKNRDCLSTLRPSGGVGVACEPWRAPVVGTADAAVCVAVCCVSSRAAARRPSEALKLYVRVWRGEECRVCCSSRRAPSGFVRGLNSALSRPHLGGTNMCVVLGLS